VENLFEDLSVKAEDRFSEDSINMPMSDWITKNTTIKTKPFSLKGYEFQEAIIDDMHENMSVIKPSQVGLTEAQIRKALAFLVRNNGTSLIFTLPTEDMYKRISKGRVKPIVDKDKVFNTAYDRANKAVRSVDMMQFGQSFLYLTPAIESAATSIAADVVMNDEVDLSDQKMITLFNSRLQGSDIALSQKFSTPTFPSFGIDLTYQASDQMEYACLCESCGHYNFPEFNKKFIHLEGIKSLSDEMAEDMAKITIQEQDALNLDESYVKCEKCHSPLDLGNPELRQWVPKYESRSSNARGYKVTPFVTQRLNPKYIMKSLWNYQENEYLRGFHNTVLGLPYSDGNMQIPKDLIEKCMTNVKYDLPVSEYDPVWIGIDMGQTCHIIRAKGDNVENLHIFSMEAVHVDNIVQTVKDDCEKYNVIGGAVDRHPYEPTSRDIFAASGGRILPVEYRGLKELNIIYDEYEEVAYGQVNRTTFLDNFAILIRKEKIKISGYGINKNTYIEHIRDMVRDETPESPAQWVKLKGNDHFFHASAFMAMGPKIAELIALKGKGEKRTMIDLQVIGIPDQTENIIGMGSGKKRVVRTFETG